MLSSGRYCFNKEEDRLNYNLTTGYFKAPINQKIIQLADCKIINRLPELPGLLLFNYL